MQPGWGSSSLIVCSALLSYPLFDFSDVNILSLCRGDSVQGPESMCNSSVTSFFSAYHSWLESSILNELITSAGQWLLCMTQITNAVRTREGMKHENIWQMLSGLFTTFPVKAQSCASFDKENKGSGAVRAPWELYWVLWRLQHVEMPQECLWNNSQMSRDVKYFKQEDKLCKEVR